MVQKMKRKTFQGILNILSFNRHFFLAGCFIVLILITVIFYTTENIRTLVLSLLLVVLWNLTIPLILSYYIYDRSGFYKLMWLSNFEIKTADQVACVNAGFDETSFLIKEKLNLNIVTFDFYNVDKHTEISIKRARDKYPPDQSTIKLNDYNSPLKHAPFDFIFVIFAAHEIRNQAERSAFFSCLRKSITGNGRIIVIEHLRNAPNLLAYTIGAFHFFSRSNWQNVFSWADLKIENEFKFTPFISLFELKK